MDGSSGTACSGPRRYLSKSRLRVRAMLLDVRSRRSDFTTIQAPSARFAATTSAPDLRLAKRASSGVDPANAPEVGSEGRQELAPKWALGARIGATDRSDPSSQAPGRRPLRKRIGRSSHLAGTSLCVCVCVAIDMVGGSRPSPPGVPCLCARTWAWAAMVANGLGLASRRSGRRCAAAL